MAIDWNSVDKVAAAFGIVVAAGGIAGYRRRGSVPSLVAGVGLGSGIAVAASWQLDRPIAAAVLSGVLTASMASRYWKSGKFMPSGLIGLGAAGMTAKFIAQIYQA
ncbi:hypothetical protein CDCA_CDCA18G4511 [Cyanidium caldarium]|uniref:Transmembrane protein 14C n=1 Tax=Cyanidium caldarium TaxID=2771 RepID=A0AAV9J247_CYACA|nr:hypothetical protein CDCA_CDCA18G4511 [Cyanidium caldarium]